MFHKIEKRTRLASGRATQQCLSVWCVQQMAMAIAVMVPNPSPFDQCHKQLGMWSNAFYQSSRACKDFVVQDMFMTEGEFCSCSCPQADLDGSRLTQWCTGCQNTDGHVEILNLSVIPHSLSPSAARPQRSNGTGCTTMVASYLGVSWESFLPNSYLWWDNRWFKRMCPSDGQLDLKLYHRLNPAFHFCGDHAEEFRRCFSSLLYILNFPS